MTLFEWLTVAITLIGSVAGAVWALISYWFSMQRKLANHKMKNVTESIGRVEHSFDKLTMRLSEVEKSADLKVHELWEKFHVLTLEMVRNAAEIKETRNSMGDISKAFTSKMDQMADKMDQMANKLHEVYLGEGRYRITSKKPNSG